MSDAAANPAATMRIERVIAAPRAVIWRAWTTPESLPLWWGPEGYSCRTKRIDLRTGGEWVFDMIGPDGTVYPNHHRYHRMEEEAGISYSLLWGEDGPKHADADVTFDEVGTDGGDGADATTRITLTMVLASEDECRAAKAFGAEALGQETLAKLARFIGAS